jgi:hypothetical protein
VREGRSARGDGSWLDDRSQDCTHSRNLLPMTKTSRETIRLYYYTGKQWGLKALWEKRLKISLYQELNDPFELSPFDLSQRAARTFWDRQVQRVLAGRHGLIGLSEDWRSTQMWSHYGEKHTGLCLGFDVSREFAAPITYIDNPLPDPTPRRQELRSAGVEVLEAALRHKSSAWSYEKEWRLRVPLPQAVDGLHFKQFDDEMHLREVIIGPRCPLSAAEVVEAVVSPPLDVEIFQARAAHGDFAMVKHERASTRTAAGFRAALSLAKDVYAHELPDD